MAKSAPLLKIGFVLDGGLEKPDGVQQYILALGKYFESLGHSVRYLVAGRIPKHINNGVSLAKSISVDSNGNRLSIPLPSSNKKIRTYLLKEKFDVLHIQTPYSPMMGEKVILAADSSTAIVGTFHIVPSSWYLSVGNWLLGKWCYFSLKKIDQMISVSSAAKRIAKRDFSVDSVILPNVVNWTRFSLAKPPNNKNIPLTILFLGRLVPRKGCLELLRAVNHLVSSNKGLAAFKVIVAGSGPLEGKLRAYVSVNNLSQIVNFIGYVDEKDKPALYASVGISVFPSTAGESFGIVLIEALASGRSAVLAGDNEGYRSVLGAKEELLFNPRDSQALADKLKYYLVNDDKRKEVASWGRNYSRQFDVNHVGNEVLSIYRASIAKKRNQIDN